MARIGMRIPPGVQGLTHTGCTSMGLPMGATPLHAHTDAVRVCTPLAWALSESLRSLHPPCPSWHHPHACALMRLPSHPLAHPAHDMHVHPSSPRSPHLTVHVCMRPRWPSLSPTHSFHACILTFATLPCVLTHLSCMQSLEKTHVEDISKIYKILKML